MYGSKVEVKSPIFKDVALAFVIGGLICVVGQAIQDGWSAVGLNQEDAGTATSVCMVLLSALLTGFNLYNKLARYGGAGHSVDEIKDFASLKTVADDIHARAAELGFDAFSAPGLDGSSSWRFSGHLANMPLFYEFRDDGITEQPATIKGTYMDNFRNIWDLYITDTAAACTLSGDQNIILDYLKKKKLECIGIVLTHYHFDHVMGIKQLKEAFPKAQVAIHQAEFAEFQNPPGPLGRADIMFFGGDQIIQVVEQQPSAEVALKTGQDYFGRARSSRLREWQTTRRQSGWHQTSGCNER